MGFLHNPIRLRNNRGQTLSLAHICVPVSRLLNVQHEIGIQGQNEIIGSFGRVCGGKKVSDLHPQCFGVSNYICILAQFLNQI